MLIKILQAISAILFPEKTDYEHYKSVLHALTNPRLIKKSNASIVYLFDYRQVKSLILKAKYKNNTRIQQAFAECLDEYLEEYLSELALWEDEFIITYIPSNIERKIKYGFNPVLNILKKSRFRKYVKAVLTNSAISNQKNLNYKERHKNKSRSLYCKTKLENIVVIVVDDVLVSGATLANAKKALMKCGAKKVELIALAKA